MKRIVFFLEEQSAAEMLKGLLPRFLPEHVGFECRVFEGKQDMEKRLSGILRAWRAPDCLFIVMRDQDSGNCMAIKFRLKEICHSAGRPDILVRIACRELESFYLGDLVAVEKGLMIRGLSLMQNKRKYRSPDKLGNPSEELCKITRGIYLKVVGSRMIGPHMNIQSNKSKSFQVLLSGIQKLLESP